MDRSRYFLIGLAVLLMAAVVVVAGQSLIAGREPARVMPVAAETTPTLPSEAGMYARVARAADYAAMPTEPNRKRTREVYYARRAYPGAPPVIPHPVDERQAFGKACLACHAEGGWVPRFEAFAPVTPHPEMTSCRQCHVPQAGRPAFQASAWEASAPPPLKGAAMLGSPPRIPHALQMRENCRACHAGPGAVDAFRTSHPQRVSCRQCHALGTTSSEAFARPGEGGAR
ncbi:MAG TPA: nitrate reductase cytochrome c-type subunit [Methylomirabilota bacterium]|nr:nitrate reductase cytochrome c-type subunit [Methylomirabilota bacterium]